MPYFKDILFIWEILLIVSKVAKIRIPLYNYVTMPGSIMTSTKFEKIYSGYDELNEVRDKYLAENNHIGEFIVPRPG